MIEPVVNSAINNRKRYPYEWAGNWEASVCGANRYDGAGSGVGWHADQLTCTSLLPSFFLISFIASSFLFFSSFLLGPSHFLVFDLLQYSHHRQSELLGLIIDLGPYTTIASLSLGTPRAFRLRQTDSINPPITPTRTYEVNLAHNSLVLMNAGCQERYKHT